MYTTYFIGVRLERSLKESTDNKKQFCSIKNHIL